MIDFASVSSLKQSFFLLIHEFYLAIFEKHLDIMLGWLEFFLKNYWFQRKSDSPSVLDT